MRFPRRPVTSRQRGHVAYGTGPGVLADNKWRVDQKFMLERYGIENDKAALAVLRKMFSNKELWANAEELARKKGLLGEDETLEQCANSVLIDLLQSKDKKVVQGAWDRLMNMRGSITGDHPHLTPSQYTQPRKEASANVVIVNLGNPGANIAVTQRSLLEMAKEVENLEPETPEEEQEEQDTDAG